MKDYSRLLEKKCHIEHVESMEEASAFCQAYGTALEEYTKEIENEMKESGVLQETKDKLIVLIVAGVLLFILMISEESVPLIGAAAMSGLMYDVIIPSISRCLGRINYSRDMTLRAQGFKHLSELKGMTDERALKYTNNLVDRYNRMVDDDEATIVDVYNCNFKKNPEKGANIALVAMGVLVFLMIAFCVINELTAL